MSLGHLDGGYRGYRADPSLVVGFDLDLTLVDSALGIAETVAQTSMNCFT